MLEMTVAVLVAMLATLGFAHTLVASMAMAEVNRETDLVAAGLRRTMESLQGTEEFRDVFALYNEEPTDDPDGAGTAPGSNFAIPGLAAQPGDADGIVGEIVFPTRSPLPGVLFLVEDIDEPALGMPRDLDGDGFIDADDHSSDYDLLPVLVRARWRGVRGDRSMEIRGFLGAR